MREMRWAVWHTVFLFRVTFALPQLPGGWPSWNPMPKDEFAIGQPLNARNDPQLSKRAPAPLIDVEVLFDICPGKNNSLAKTEIETLFEIQCGVDHYGGGKYS
ncbi:hypothetical protein K491DRAFT_716145 [Lophiostoma macrostomum CBS 122681]|uniref:Glycoside hydrolase family 16 protein n=1 Tax=Lophiostoma macrostomum CBS 122681 TaxID=1314788 RepID=A0A6A6T8F0_9PLEO|nr:hypothetical protein K491DRAFT_716145 [Lophiostoma macrostomum CBS 122681]